jgi:hypothetical protein
MVSMTGRTLVCVKDMVVPKAMETVVAVAVPMAVVEIVAVAIQAAVQAVAEVTTEVFTCLAEFGKNYGSVGSESEYRLGICYFFC